MAVVVGSALSISFPGRVVSGRPPRVELLQSRLSFHVHSTGPSHTLVIDGVPGFVASVGGAGDVVVTGRYRLHCTIPGHTEAGEAAILVVT